MNIVLGRGGSGHLFCVPMLTPTTVYIPLDDFLLAPAVVASSAMASVLKTNDTCQREILTGGLIPKHMPDTTTAEPCFTVENRAVRQIYQC